MLLLDGKDKELSDFNFFSFILHVAPFNWYNYFSATTNKLNVRPSSVIEWLVIAFRLEKNPGRSTVYSLNEMNERVKEVTDSKAPFVV